ncbi:DUF7764 domain-containing protein [Haloarchaeobius sp. DYHT-AS-18]|uniref:DISARM anti-phage system protein DrmE domain-containing protein n=1 Tax=Haloarchaeobius sp. DYHT-AS-18 TaxID=3446117 RepID=UPI003EBEC5A4
MSGDDVLELQGVSAPVLGTDRDGRLSYQKSEAAFTRLDRSYIAAAAAAFSSGRDIALIYPSPPTFVQLPILLAVGYQCRGRGPPALFVSNRSGVRDQYFNLGIGPFHPAPGIEPEPLGEFTAPMVRTGDGESVSYITRHKPRNWEGKPHQAAIVHTNFGKSLAHDCKLNLSGLVLDFTTGLLDDRAAQEGWEKIAREQGIPRIMIFDSPTHEYLESLAKENERRAGAGVEEILFWGWSHGELQAAPQKLLEPVADLDMGSTDGGPDTDDGSVIANPFRESVGPLVNIARGINREIVEIPHGPLEEVSREAWKRINETAQTLREEPEVSSFAHQSVANAYFIYSYLDTLLPAVDYHDSLMRLDDTESWGAGKTIQHMINSLRKRQDSLDDEILGVGEQIADCCDAFERMADALREHNPKADELATQVRNAIESDCSMTVLSATRKQESIIRSFITERTEFSGEALSGSSIKFHNLYSPHTIPESDILLFPGVPTNSHYPALLAGAAPEHRFLIYSWTRSRFERRLADVLDKAEWRAGGGPQHHFIQEMGLSSESLSEFTLADKPRAPRPYDYRRAQQSEGEKKDSVSISRSNARSGGSTKIGRSTPTAPEDVSIDLEDLRPDDNDDFWVSEQEFDSGEQQETINAGRSVADAQSNERGEVEAIRIDFTDDTLLYEQPGGHLWKLYDEGGQLRRKPVAAQALKKGDEVIVIKDDSRRDIFEHIVEKIHSECRGPFQDYLSMLDLWTTGLDKIMESLTPSDEEREELGILEDVNPSKRQMAEWIQADLKEWSTKHEEDPTRTANQIKKWLQKETIGPSNAAVIRALGDIYNVESLRAHSEQIFKGLEEVRKLHVRVGMNLSKILIGARESDRDDWLLEECGLRIGDVQSATAVKTVEKVGDEWLEISTTRLGRLIQR